MTLFAVLSSAGRLHSREADKNADRLTLLDGSSVVGRITSIESSGRLSVDGVVSPFHISALRSIQRPTRAAAHANGKTDAESVVIDLVGGGRILANTLTIADERCQISWKFGDRLAVPLDMVRAIRFENKISPETQIELHIIRKDELVFHGLTNISNMRRSFEEIIEFLFRECDFPNGCFLMTGTGIVPEEPFTLEVGDVIQIMIEGIGTLMNKVARKPKIS